MPESSTIGQRFTQLIQQLGLSKNAFAMSLDKTATVIQHLVDERNKPGYDLICKVFETYPNVSKDWLLLGAGPMMLSGAKVADAADVTPAVAPVAIAKPVAAPGTPNFPAALFTVSAARPAAVAPAPVAPPVDAERPTASPVASSPVLAAEPPSQPMLEATQAISQPELVPAPAIGEFNPAPTSTLQAAIPATSDALAAALHAQYLQHQLALAEQRNQHLLAQQQLMQQMLDFLRRPN